MTSADIENLDDNSFAATWRAMELDEKAAMPAATRRACAERYSRLTPYIGRSVEKLARGEKHLDAAISERLAAAQIDGAELLDAIHALLGRFIAYPCDSTGRRCSRRN